jgi:acetyl-CoA acyltransferase
MSDPVIVSAVRTAVGKAGRGALARTRPDDLAAEAIKGALARVPAVTPDMIDDVILGCAMPEAEQGMNVARIASLLAGIPHRASAMTVNRFCSSGLQAIALAHDAIAAGRAQVAIAGGTESMSLIPMGGHKISPNPSLLERYPDSYLGMGMTAELVARKYGIDRERADAFALRSHQRAVAAIDGGRDRSRGRERSRL